MGARAQLVCAALVAGGISFGATFIVMRSTVTVTCPSGAASGANAVTHHIFDYNPVQTTGGHGW